MNKITTLEALLDIWYGFMTFLVIVGIVAISYIVTSALMEAYRYPFRTIHNWKAMETKQVCWNQNSFRQINCDKANVNDYKEL